MEKRQEQEIKLVRDNTMKNKPIFIKLIVSLLLIFVGVAIAYFLNYSILNNIVIGNEEAYDTQHIETGFIFNLFYTISSETGYHPEPSYFNFLLTTLVGVIVGGFMSYKFIWKKK